MSDEVGAEMQYYISGLVAEKYHTDENCFYLRQALTVSEVSEDYVDGLEECGRCAGDHGGQTNHDLSYQEALRG